MAALHSLVLRLVFVVTCESTAPPAAPEMLGKAPNIFFRLCWKFFCPVLVLCILISSIVQYSPTKYEKFTYPLWAELVGVCIGLTSIVWIPLGAIQEIYNNEGSLLQRLKTASTPTIDLDAEDWLPEKQNLDISASETLLTSVA